MSTEILNTFYSKATRLKEISTLELKLIKLIDRELKKLESNDLLPLSNRKVLFNYQFIQILSKKNEFIKNSITAYNLTKKLKKKKLISSKSIMYPKNIKFFSTNPLDSSFLYSNLSTVDQVAKVFETFVKDNVMDKDIKLYIYLRVFFIKKISLDRLRFINNDSYVKLNNDNSILLIVDIKNIHTRMYRPIDIIFLDSNLKVLCNDLKNSNKLCLSDSIKNYEYQLNKFLINNRLTLTQIRNSMAFIYQLKNSPLKLTIMKSTIYPKITLKELDYLFSGTIQNSFLDLESINQDIYFSKISRDEDEDEILEENDKINNYITKDIEKYDDLRTILTLPKDFKGIDKFFDRYYRFLSQEKYILDPLLSLFCKYLVFIMKKADKREKSFNNIKISTMKDYFSIAFNYAFNFIVAEGELNDQTIILINDNITHNQNLTIKTQKKYKRIVNFFLRSFTQYNTLEKINIAMDVRRTIVFQEEINEFVNLIIKEDKVKFQLTKNIKIKSNIRAVFILLLYYSGLRKTELRTRMLNDIYMLDEETFVIDVNSKGFRETMKSTGETELKLKTSNARRRVKFKISDKNHLHIVKSYLHFLEERQFKFLFPSFNSKSQNLQKKHVISDSFISDLSKVLQSVTNRYTPLHSLRHTFATNYFIRNINKNEQHIVYELANLLGHSDPTVTINNYLHLDFLSFSNSYDYKNILL